MIKLTHRQLIRVKLPVSVADALPHFGLAGIDGQPYELCVQTRACQFTSDNPAVHCVEGGVVSRQAIEEGVDAVRSQEGR